MGKLQKEDERKVQIAVEIYNCPYCGYLISKTTKICPDCGERIIKGGDDF